MRKNIITSTNNEKIQVCNIMNDYYHLMSDLVKENCCEVAQYYSSKEKFHKYKTKYTAKKVQNIK